MISVIGAGPVGAYTSFQLAKRGFEVSLFEEHKTVGTPVQCTGIVTQDIHKLMNVPKKTIVNKIRNIDVISPNKNSFRLKLRKPELILNRTLFDNAISDLAVKEGVKSEKNSRFIEKKGNKIILSINNEKKEINNSHLIGADGPLSRVAKSAGLLKKRQYFNAMQVTIKGDFDKESYQIFLGSDYPEFFGWLVPESEELARIGMGTRGNSLPLFHKFLKTHVGENFKKRIISHQNGLIPLFSPFEKIQKNSTYLVGDAASQVKATTGGGIIPGMKAGIALAQAIAKKTSYTYEFWKSTGPELLAHRILRHFMDRFKDKDFNKFVAMSANRHVLKVLSTTSRERPTSIFLKTLLRDPRFLLFAKTIWQKKHTTPR